MGTTTRWRVLAELRGRAAEFREALMRENMLPIVIEDLVHIGEDRGRDEARAALRAAVIDLLAGRGIVLSPAARQRVLTEPSLDTLRAWLQRATTSVSERGVFER